MRGREGKPAVWASGTARAVVLLAVVGAIVTAGGPGATTGASPGASTGAPDPPAARPTVVETLAPAPPASPAKPTWVGATPLARSVPVRVQIPAIGVDSELMELGLQADGTMQVPAAGFPAGWYTGAPTPGELGPAVIAGHVDWNGPGVFADLHSVQIGDQVTVTRADGSAPVFQVVRVEQYPKAGFPTDEVYGDIDRAGLRLITCGGVFNRTTGHHDDNIVVFADLIDPAVG